MDTTNHRPAAGSAFCAGESGACFHQQLPYDACQTDLSRRSIDWRDSGIVIDEDNHLFETLCNTDTRSSINWTECSWIGGSQAGSTAPTKSSGVGDSLPTATCYPSKNTGFEQDDDGDTILHLAVVGLTLKRVKDLINLCDLNAINNMMQTPLHVAVLANRPEMVQLLVNSRARLGVHDRQGNTPLHLASQRGFREIVTILLDASAAEPQGDASPQQMIETCNFDGYTSLHLAATHDQRDIIELLVVKYGANMNYRDSKAGETIMHKAVRQFNVDLVAFILKLSNRHCNEPDFAGRTPLETIEILQEAHPKDAELSAKLARIASLISTSIRDCVANRGCCSQKLLTPRSDSLEVSDYSSSGSDCSESDFEMN